MFGLGMPELLVVFLIIFLLFGAKKLPGIARALGKAVREFRNPTEEKESEPVEEKAEEQKQPEEKTEELERE